MKKFLFAILGVMLIAQAVQSATIEIGDLSPQIQKSRTTTQTGANSFKVPDVLPPKDATRPQESMTVTTSQKTYASTKQSVAKTEPVKKEVKEKKKVVTQNPEQTQTTKTVTKTTYPAKKEKRSGHEWVFAKELKVIEKGEPFSYPIPEGAVIECYAKKVDGSIDAFEEYNDYFVMKGGELYSDTLHRLYKPEKNNELKKVDRVSVTEGGTKLKMYDPLWEKNLRHHKRNIVIDLTTGAYHMSGVQDNAMWYRTITTTGVCRVR